ncbi:DUF2071 domain-containing protein [Chitinophaga sp. OAE865]|uniref:DUF2071 domain-containing protein n=1 Tax=Chitinophaga sp. OAE865 TaxID=2817898 RepID=UPI001AE33972
MLAFLKNHPFAVEAFFESSLVLTYAFPIAVLKALLPPRLEPDVFQDQWAFIAIAIVKTKNLRPKGFPAFMGNDFVLTGYRVFVRYTNSEGKRLRGLYILKSETDRKKMQFLGNLFTRYRYTTTDITVSGEKDIISVRSVASGLDITVDAGDVAAALPEGSPFNNWKEARRFAGPLPFTFTCNEQSDEVLIIEGVREHWEPVPVAVLHSEIRFLHHPALQGGRLANAFIIRQIPYYWKKGKVDIWRR